MRRRQANIVVIVSSAQWNMKISEGAFIFMHLLCFHESHMKDLAKMNVHIHRNKKSFLELKYFNPLCAVAVGAD